MSKHTPGPWIVDVGAHVIFVYTNNGEINPYKIISSIGLDQLNCLQDAKLVAAAPDMLEALQAAIKLSDDWFAEQLAAGHDLERTPECQAVYDKVKAAISKATL